MKIQKLGQDNALSLYSPGPHRGHRGFGDGMEAQ